MKTTFTQEDLKTIEQLSYQVVGEFSDLVVASHFDLLVEEFEALKTREISLAIQKGMARKMIDLENQKIQPGLIRSNTSESVFSRLATQNLNGLKVNSSNQRIDFSRELYNKDSTDFQKFLDEYSLDKNSNKSLSMLELRYIFDKIKIYNDSLNPSK